MGLPVFLALILLAGSTQSASDPRISWPDINISEIIANLPDILANIIDFIRGIDWSEVVEAIRNIIEILPELIDRLPEIIANLPGSLPEIIGNIVAAVPDLVDRIREIIASIQEIISQPDVIASLNNILDRIRDLVAQIDWDAISDALPDINLPDIDWAEVVANLPELIANLPELIANLPDILENLPEIIGNIPEIIDNIDWPAIIDALPSLNRDIGEPSNIQEYPGLVQIEAGYYSLWLLACTGNILNRGFLLTSARCVSGKMYDPRIRRVKAGANTRGGPGAVYPFSFATVHPSYGSNGFEANIAVVRILGLFDYGPTVQPVSIVNQGVFFPAGIRVTNAGWGSTAQGRNIADSELYKADLYVSNNLQCAQSYNNLPIPITVTESMICAGRARSGGRVADLRDAGGPLYYDNVLVGVLSHGIYMGNDSMPVVAISVSSYTSWIVANAV